MCNTNYQTVIASLTKGLHFALLTQGGNGLSFKAKMKRKLHGYIYSIMQLLLFCERIV